MATVGVVQVGVTADTRKLKKNLAGGTKDVRRFARDASSATREGASGFQNLGQWARKSTETIKFGSAEATRGLLQMGDAAGVAGKAASGVTAGISGLVQGGLVGLGIAGVTTLFAVVTEESRKAREAAEAEAEKAREKAAQFAEQAVSEAQRSAESIASVREKSAERAFEHELTLREEAANRAGAFFDRQLAVELRAARSRRAENRHTLGTELGAIAELRDALRTAAKENQGQLREAINLRERNVEAIRREIELEARRPDQARAASALRQRAQALEEIRAAKDKEHARDVAAAKSASDEVVALTRQVEERLRLAQLTDEQRKDADDLALIARLEAIGKKEHADAVRKLLAFEKERKRVAEENAAIEERNKGASGIEDQLRRRREMAQATTEEERLLAAQKQEQVELLKQGVSQVEIWNTHLVERKALKDRERAEQDNFLQGLRDAIELEKAKTKEKRAQIERAQELRDIEREHGAEARKLQEDLNALRDAKGKQDGAGGGGGKGSGGGGGKAILGYGARGEIVYTDGSVDKGLKRRKNLRKAQNRLRKLQGQATGRGLKPGDSGTLGGMISGRSLPPGIGFSEFDDGTRKRKKESEGGQVGVPFELHKPGDKGRGGKQDGPKPPGTIDRPVTSTGGSPADNREAGVEHAKDAAEASKKHDEAIEKQNEGLGELKDNVKASADAAETGTEHIEALVEASTELAEQSEATASALEGAVPELTSTMKSVGDKLSTIESDVEDLRAGLETVQQSLGN